MTLTGHIRNGVVVFDGTPTLPEGAMVTVSVADPPMAGQRLDFPLIRTGPAGVWNLTNERIGAIFEEEDLEMMRRSGVETPS